jgi:hypothetical protein
MGMIDVPTVTDKILQTTGKSKIECYLGVSMGSTVYFAGAAMKPDFYNSKFHMMIAQPTIIYIHLDPITSVGSLLLTWWTKFEQQWGFADNTYGIVSWRNLDHFAQNQLAAKFMRYDYGLFENLNQYGVSPPPEYDLSKLHMKVNLFIGGNDNFYAGGYETLKDWMCDSSKIGIKNLNCIVYEDYGHNFAYNLADLNHIYDDLIPLIKNSPSS